MPVTSSSLIKKLKDSYEARVDREVSFEEHVRSVEEELQAEWELPQYLFDVNVLTVAKELGETAYFYQNRHQEWIAEDQVGFSNYTPRENKSKS